MDENGYVSLVYATSEDVPKNSGVAWASFPVVLETISPAQTLLTINPANEDELIAIYVAAGIIIEKLQESD